MSDGGAEQEALYEIYGPDADCCVWLVSGKCDRPVVVSLGLGEAVAEKLSNWLAKIDFIDRFGL
jgi:hypothetical protein